MSLNAQGVVAKAVDVGNQFKDEQDFECRDQMLQWIRMEASKQGFSVVIKRFDNSLDIRCVFLTMTCERSGKCRTPLWNFKRDDVSSRKCECSFKVCGYMLANKNWIFNVICEKYTCNIETEKTQKYINIKKEYNIRYQANKTLRGDKTEMQQLLILLDDNSYMSRYRTDEDGITVKDIFYTHPDSIKLFNTFPTVLILDSLYKTNKYRLPLLKMWRAVEVGAGFDERERSLKNELKIVAHGRKLIEWLPYILPSMIERWLSNFGLSSIQRTNKMSDNQESLRHSRESQHTSLSMEKAKSTLTAIR
ncbi:uncharacterized protein LOC127099463 [Lathyrus oleraceus]|uniref:uncharacterized protein LOC127099463 n=1 Tax=Pisum sativum TaxID=3888 RepID=UPI0021D13A9F|nr:uncharacterized protein LOC127099463 [Pisum sativum]